MTDYMEKIKETIQQHPEIHPSVVSDVLYRSRCWLEAEYTQSSDNYIKRQFDYLCQWIK